MASFEVVCNAYVPHPALLRDRVLRVVLTELFRARRIEEFTSTGFRSIPERGPDLSARDTRPKRVPQNHRTVDRITRILEEMDRCD